ncbi:SCO1860 family LAETG-anchored protein [Actinacidiphila rubida]|uniref:LPXTG-motif cell wall anchor domain-containing protein n=1 Tax=Actinacidiphila rubida TaxID=310780 RepID=A0A1H8SC85_9ACTN|nr:SCO1860 family LAETG-anchored protein [Actinacidiphila rubida]SEO75868.1 LPXTG-motif cell wall anchor domain-containing protein [Actinacidiphila rubida]
MYRTINFLAPLGRSARRSAAVIGTAVALAAGSAAFAPAVQAAPASSHADGSATATVLRAGLDVSLLHKTVDVPVDVSLNDVRAPGDARETALTVTVGHGVELGRPITLLQARVATANATVDHRTARGYANIVDAELHLPGLPLLSLVKLDAITSKATCTAGRAPAASSTLAGVTVLGRHIALNAVGTTELSVPGVGRVSLELNRTDVTSSSAAATALHLGVHVNPLNLGVAEVSGDVTLAQATCHTPHGGGSTGGSTSGGSTDGGSTDGGSTDGGSTDGGGGSTSGSTSGGSTTGSTAGSTSGSTTGTTSGATGTSGSTTSGGSSGTGGSDTHAQTVSDNGNLAETGASSSTPYLAGGAAVLVAAGAGAVLLAGRRRRSSASRDGR